MGKAIVQCVLGVLAGLVVDVSSSSPASNTAASCCIRRPRGSIRG
jgi:hypothetical protein